MYEKLHNLALLLLFATIIVSGCGPSDRVGELIKEIKSSDVSTRQKAAYEFAEVKDSRAVPVLIEALKDMDKIVRCQSALALGRINDKRAVEPLLNTLKDEDWRVRAYVASALGVIGDKRAVVPLIAALEDDNFAVRLEATRALGDFGDVRAIESLGKVLNDKEGEVRVRGVYALGSMGKPAHGILLEALRNKHEDVRFETVRYFGYLREKAAVPHLIEALKDNNSDLSWQVSVVWTLGQIGEPAVEPLIEAMENKNNNVLRYWAADVLKDITGKDFGEDHAKWKAWYEKNKDK